jgi:sugar/nucleoside kinase (ribokinase family)
VLVLGDLALDVVLAAAEPLRIATDVPGRVAFRQGGSAATTARWLALLGARSTLVTAVGRDRIGRALVDVLRRDGVVVHASRVAGLPTARIGVLVDPTGERSFVADREAAERLSPEAVSPGWFRSLDGIHLPVYSFHGEPLAHAARRAIRLARDAGAAVSLDLASIGPLMARGRGPAESLVRDVRPDLVFATAAEVAAFVGPRRPLEDLLAFAPLAIVKRGASGASVLLDRAGDRIRFDVATQRVPTNDTTGAGDAFDAAALVTWLSARGDDRARPAVLRRAAHAGQRAAVRQLTGARSELSLG